MSGHIIMCAQSETKFEISLFSEVQIILIFYKDNKNIFLISRPYYWKNKCIFSLLVCILRPQYIKIHMNHAEYFLGTIYVFCNYIIDIHRKASDAHYFEFNVIFYM